MALTVDSPEIEEFLTLARANAAVSPYSHTATHARDRRKYIALDNRDSAVFLVDKQTGIVYNTAGYGKRGRYIGTLQSLIDQYRETNAHNDQFLAEHPQARGHGTTPRFTVIRGALFRRKATPEQRRRGLR